MGNKLTVIWRDESVGELRNAVPDMWYLEGTWLPFSTQSAQEFDQLARSFDGREVMSDPKKGTRIVLCDPDVQDHQGINALVISISDDRLFVRQVFNKDAIAWLKDNVQ
jgi:hypothetical protein